jgi:adenosylmethionine-8-amino-7-oxononanoate aminotransferase
MPNKWPFLGGGNTRVASAAGAYVTFDDGSRVLDAAGGAIVANIGYGNDRVADAIGEASRRTSYVLPPWLTPEREALIEELSEHWLDPRLNHFHFTSGGSEGVESAIKLAVQFHAARGEPDRSRILTRDISYHGTTIVTAGLSGHPARKRGIERLIPEPTYIKAPYPLRQEGTPEDATRECLASLEAVIDRVGAGNIAALVAEPVTGTSGGAIVPPPGYWDGVQSTLRRHGILLIVDEVMTGFGRLGARMGSELYGIEPDILVGGKGLAGGYAPMCGVFGTGAVADAIADGGLDVMFHTFGALPASCAAGTTVLQILREDDLVARATSVGARLKADLQSALGQHPLVAEVRGEGLLLAVEIVRDRETLERFPADLGITNKLVGAAMGKGVFFYPGGTGEVRDLICMGPAFIIGDEETDQMVSVLETVLNDLHAGL